MFIDDSIIKWDSEHSHARERRGYFEVPEVKNIHNVGYSLWVYVRDDCKSESEFSYKFCAYNHEGFVKEGYRDTEEKAMLAVEGVCAAYTYSIIEKHLLAIQSDVTRLKEIMDKYEQLQISNPQATLLY